MPAGSILALATAGPRWDDWTMLDHPLRFQPLFRRYLWGGRRLGTHLGKAIGAGEDYAESWEIVDHGNDQSIVAAGEFAGCRLHDLVKSDQFILFGHHAPQ